MRIEKTKARTEKAEVLNPCSAVEFQHNGLMYVLPKGRSVWPWEIAERVERKYSTTGVRIVHCIAPPEPPEAKS